MPLLDASGDVAGVLEFLRREPVLNTVPLGLFGEARDPEKRRNWFLATVERDGDIVASAFRTEFPKMGLAGQGDPGAMAELARLVHRAMPEVPCVIGPDAQLRAFVVEWTRLSGSAGAPGMPERLHRLTRVRPQPYVPGKLRRATAANRPVLVPWMQAFAAEAGTVETAVTGWAAEATDVHLERGSLYLWEDRVPASMSGGRETGDGVARIGPVYTPPASRRRGYAGALVAQLSQLLLDGGCHTCCLFTDTRNATSNHVYAEVGYEPIADINEVWFRPL